MKGNRIGRCGPLSMLKATTTEVEDHRDDICKASPNHESVKILFSVTRIQ